MQKDIVILRRGDADYSGIGSKHYKAGIEAAFSSHDDTHGFYAEI
jgi:hypothetical protein